MEILVMLLICLVVLLVFILISKNNELEKADNNVEYYKKKADVQSYRDAIKGKYSYDNRRSKTF